MEYLKNGVFYTIFLGGAAFLCGRPEYIKRDEQNRLHCEDGPAIRWKDGYCNYFWHGVSVPEKLIERPDEITKEDLINETNAEVRRAMMEKLGERFYSLGTLYVRVDGAILALSRFIPTMNLIRSDISIWLSLYGPRLRFSTPNIEMFCASITSAKQR